MQKIIFSISMFLCLLAGHAQVGIGTTTPDPATVLDINAQILPGRFGGVKLPTVTLAQRATIATPIPDGLMIYVNDGNTRCVQLYDATQALWVNWYCMNELPVANAVDYSGMLEVGETLTASYTYSDGENDTEAGTTYQWYRATDAAGTGATPIASATGATYTTTASDGDFFIAVGVTPRAASGASPGVEVRSTYRQIAFQQTVVAFAFATTGVPEDDIRTVTINVTNPSATVATTVELNIDAVNSTIGTLGTAYDIDYNSAAITGYPFVVTIPAGANTATFDFFAFADDNNAIDEVLTLELQNVSGGTNAVLGTQTIHTRAVKDDDTATAVAFTSTSSSVNEPVAVGNASTIAVGITNPSASAATTVTVALDPSSTAEAGDYSVTYGGSPVSLPFTVTFPAGQSTDESFTITALDDADTDDETLVLNLTTPAGGIAVATVGANNAHTLTIEDDEVSANASDLFISEYIEGSSSNKYLEIANFTGATVNLSDYRVRLYTNGSGSPNNTEDFSGAGFPATLANGEVLILRNSSAALSIPGNPTTYSSSVCNFNGDDAIELFNNATGISIDVFGRIGQDPGSSWSVTGNITENRTLVRNVGVGPNADNVAGFPSLGTEWTQFPQDNVTNLGSHNF